MLVDYLKSLCVEENGENKAIYIPLVWEKIPYLYGDKNPEGVKFTTVLQMLYLKIESNGYLSQSELGKILNVSRKCINAQIRKLEDLNLLVKEPRKGAGYFYRVLPITDRHINKENQK